MVKVAQEVPCRLLPVHEVPIEPLWQVDSERDLQFAMPPIRQLRQTLDRCRQLNTNDLTLACNARGDLKVRAETTAVQLTTHYSSLLVHGGGEYLNDQDKF